jgi:hypothetical protein
MIDFGIWRGCLSTVVQSHHQHQAGLRRKLPLLVCFEMSGLRRRPDTRYERPFRRAEATLNFATLFPSQQQGSQRARVTVNLSLNAPLMLCAGEASRPLMHDPGFLGSNIRRASCLILSQSCS